MIDRLKEFVKDWIVSAAERVSKERKARMEVFERERKEAEDFVITKIIGEKCVHKTRGSGGHHFRYCDQCPISAIGPRELSYGASKRICSRKRRYSK